MKPLFDELNWPKALNLDLIRSLISRDDFLNLVLKNLEKDRKVRRIVLPSKSCLKKCVAFHYGQLVAKGIMTWPQVIEELKKGTGKSIKGLGLFRAELKRLHKQRAKEISKEE
jgi:hypothetical protein